MEQTHKRTITGTVVSTAMNKTAVIRVDRFVMHPMYHKRMKISKRFKARTDGSYRVGERVTIEETRPLSKEVRWIIRSRA